MKHMKRILTTCWILQRSLTFNKNMSSAISPNFKFDNAVLRELPVDKEYGNRQRQVSGACFSLVDQMPVENPKLVSYSESALSLLGIKESDLKDDGLVEILAGNQLVDGSQPAAHCYCGHQFGYFSGQLGDGAAM